MLGCMTSKWRCLHHFTGTTPSRGPSSKSGKGAPRQASKRVCGSRLTTGTAMGRAGPLPRPSRRIIDPTAVVSVAEVLSGGYTSLGRVQPYEAHIGYLMQFMVCSSLQCGSRRHARGARAMGRGAALLPRTSARPAYEPRAYHCCCKRRWTTTSLAWTISVFRAPSCARGCRKPLLHGNPMRQHRARHHEAPRLRSPARPPVPGYKHPRCRAIRELYVPARLVLRPLTPHCRYQPCRRSRRGPPHLCPRKAPPTGAKAADMARPRRSAHAT